MVVVCCGTRTLDDYALVKAKLDMYLSRVKSAVVYTGAARGADALCERWAWENGVTVKRFHADWNKHGKKAGPIRNAEMLEAAGPKATVIAFWDGKSPGTKQCLELARGRGLRIRVVMYAVVTTDKKD